MIRNRLFQLMYWATSLFFGMTALPLLLLPSRKPMMAWIRFYTWFMCLWMRIIAGIRISVRGREKVPDGPTIIAAKHQSWGDGFLMFSQFYDLAFVTGDHLEKIPLLGTILRKMGAIIVDNCGGAFARAKLVDTEMVKARNDGRRILIYPEGHLSQVGHHYRYRKGVYHMYEAYERPVVPVATNLGLFWPQQTWNLKPGVAVIEFLDPIEPGLEKEEFMARLQEMIETRSLALLPKDYVIEPANDEENLLSSPISSSYTKTIPAPTQPTSS